MAICNKFKMYSNRPSSQYIGKLELILKDSKHLNKGPTNSYKLSWVLSKKSHPAENKGMVELNVQSITVN